MQRSLKLLTKISTPVNHILLVVLAGFLVQTTWLLLAPTTDDEKIYSSKAFSNKKPQKTLTFKPIFGEVIVQKTVVKKAPVRHIQTKLNLKLKGVWLNHKYPKKSYAIIELSGQDKIYYPQDKISSLATLTEVAADYITLNRSGQIEVLYLRTPSKKLAVEQAQPVAQSTKLQPTLSNIDKTQLNNIRKTLKTNPWKLAQIMSINPSYKNGKLQGFKIRPGSQRTLFYKLGLAVNDVVYEINGKSLEISQLNAVLNTVVNNGNITIGFYRNNISHSLILNL